METLHIRELIQCLVCMEEYDEGFRMPKSLPCTHTVCMSCARRILRAGTENLLICPECRAHHYITDVARDLPTNSTITRLMSTRQEYQIKKGQSDRKDILRTYLATLKAEYKIWRSRMDEAGEKSQKVKMDAKECKIKVDKAIDKYLFSVENAARQQQRELHCEIDNLAEERMHMLTFPVEHRYMQSCDLQKKIEELLRMPIIFKDSFDKIEKEQKHFLSTLPDVEQDYLEEFSISFDIVPVPKLPLVSVQLPPEVLCEVKQNDIIAKPKEDIADIGENPRFSYFLPNVDDTPPLRRNKYGSKKEPGTKTSTERPPVLSDSAMLGMKVAPRSIDWYEGFLCHPTTLAISPDGLAAICDEGNIKIVGVYEDHRQCIRLETTPIRLICGRRKLHFIDSLGGKLHTITETGKEVRVTLIDKMTTDMAVDQNSIIYTAAMKDTKKRYNKGVPTAVITSFELTRDRPKVLKLDLSATNVSLKMESDLSLAVMETGHDDHTRLVMGTGLDHVCIFSKQGDITQVLDLNRHRHRFSSGVGMKVACYKENIIVADCIDEAIHIFDKKGHHISRIEGVKSVSGLAVTGKGDIVITSAEKKTISIS